MPSIIRLACFPLLAALAISLAVGEAATYREFKGVEIPMTAAEIVNPGRGYYNDRQIPVAGSAGYERLAWRDIEPVQGAIAGGQR